MSDPLFWLSFADPDRPTGTQFLGACMVRAPDDITAVVRAHALGINPGGEVAMVQVPGDGLEFEPYANRLLNKAGIRAMDAALKGEPS